MSLIWFVFQPCPQRLSPSSPVWTRPRWCWSGCFRGTQGAARTWCLTSSARAAAEDGAAAPAVETTCSFCPVSWAWQKPGSTLVTCWPTHNTHLRCRLSMECQIRAPTPPSMPQSTSPLTRLVSGSICHFLHLIFPMWFHPLSNSPLFSPLIRLYFRTPLWSHAATYSASWSHSFLYKHIMHSAWTSTEYVFLLSCTCTYADLVPWIEEERSVDGVTGRTWWPDDPFTVTSSSCFSDRHYFFRPPTWLWCDFIKINK